MAENKKPVKVIKAGDMSPETKALPDEVVKPPKGIGSSENDMGPLPVKKAEPKKKEDKEHRKQERKQNSNGGKLEDMLAYVDENGEISSTPPDIKQVPRPTNR